MRSGVGSGAGGEGTVARRLSSSAATEETTTSSPSERKDIRSIPIPTCARKPLPRAVHPHETAPSRVDPYSWMDEGKGENEELVEYLNAENAYHKEVYSSTNMATLKQTLYEEILSRIQETDESVPYRRGPYVYYTKTIEGLQYGIHCRRRVNRETGEEGPEQVLADMNAIAGDAEYCGLGQFDVSPSHELLAYGVDFGGEEKYTVHIADISDKHLDSLRPFETITEEEEECDQGSDKAEKADKKAEHSGIVPKHVYDTLLHEVSDELVWSADNSHVFYITFDQAQRPYRLWRHDLTATPKSTAEEQRENVEKRRREQQSDEEETEEESEEKEEKKREERPAGNPHSVLIYEESDERFNLCLDQTRDERFIILSLNSSVTSEVWLLPSSRPRDPFQLVQKREHNVEYSVETHGDNFFMVTNADGAHNSRILVTPVPRSLLASEAPKDAEKALFEGSSDSRWEEFLPHDKKVRIQDIMPFRNFLVVPQRKAGLPQLQIIAAPNAGEKIQSAKSHFVNASEAAYDCYTSNNHEYDTDTLRYVYTSFVTPRSVFAYDMATRSKALLKEQPVLGGYDRSLYAVRRLHATAGDGTEVPISLVVKKDTPLDGSAPCLLYGYGSYEIAYDAAFNPAYLSLLDRGFVFAIAHVRGGGEMGRYWYEEGKFQNKKNTFSDFIACMDHLVKENYTKPERLAIYGASAGGLLVGAVLNMTGNSRCHAAVARVPFVDVINTLLNKDLPLTIPEWEEWGNPFEDRAVYDYICSYSPYDNVSAQAYPHMLIKGGLNDPRVSVHEPAKWAASLRHHKTDDNLMLVKTNMGAGHFGPSGRYEHMKSYAGEMAFVLNRLGFDS